MKNKINFPPQMITYFECGPAWPPHHLLGQKAKQVHTSLLLGGADPATCARGERLQRLHSNVFRVLIRRRNSSAVRPISAALSLYPPCLVSRSL